VPAAPAPRDNVREIHRRLKREHGPLESPRRLEPLEELILTVLSQNTSDVNRDRAWEALRRRYPTWEALARARVGNLVDTIRVGGLGNTKAPRILAILREIRRREGGFDLAWMRTAPDEEIRDYLASLPGVGPKTVACVLAFSLGRPALPVDTHVHRVTGRLGLLPEETNAVSAHRILEELVPPKLRLPMHVGLIRHGRTVCKAGWPQCGVCVLQDLCPSAARFLGERPRGIRKAGAREKAADT
jgi:endonuclease-3